MRSTILPYAAQYRKYRRRQRGRIAFALLLLFGAGLAFAASAVFEMDAWSKLDISRITQVPQTLILYDQYDEEITTLHGAQDRIWIPLSQIPKQTRDAFISAEDARFYDHFGVDIVRILGAAWADLKAGSYVQGASTISQQLIKLSHLTSDKQIKRKLEEAVLAYQMERVCSKEEILEMYLNYVYFGGGYYGVEAAARGYFGIPASDLSVAQSAQLAGILKSPSRFAPHLQPVASQGRRDVVLSLMEEYGFLSPKECAAAKAEEVKLVHGTQPERRGYYVDLALGEACKQLNISMDTLLTGGYRIETMMEPDIQMNCEQLFADNACFPQVDGESPEAAIVIVDVKSGGVAALLGGRENNVALAYNRATRIRRQPGSVIKPILVYAPALETGYTAATMLLDEQIDFDGYRPSSPSDTFAGWVTMREAVTRSLNVPAVSVMAQIGVPAGKAFAEKLGIVFDERDKSLALALGGFTYGVSPMQIAGAYAMFANGGQYNIPSV
ncbi:MAG: transglycosylase domain-containing protein, partial [Clostridia bacterium]